MIPNVMEVRIVRDEECNELLKMGNWILIDTVCTKVTVCRGGGTGRYDEEPLIRFIVGRVRRRENSERK